MNSYDHFPFLWPSSAGDVPFLPEVFSRQYEDIKSRLLAHGAVLFKKFGIDNALKLEECVAAFPGGALDYIDGNSPRTKLQGKVYTSTEHSADAFISLHNELSYTNNWPKHLFFCCETPPSEGGNTVIADSRLILRDLSERVRQTFREKGVRYIRNLHGGFGPGPSWMDTFETDSKEKVEQHCQANDIAFEWKGNNGLRLVQDRQAIVRHPETGEEVWFNQADQFHPTTNPPEVYEALMEIYEEDPHDMPQYACFGDGSEIPVEMLEEVREVTRENTALFTWEKGDLLLLDNTLAAHGRNPYTGPRKILVAMSS